MLISIIFLKKYEKGDLSSSSLLQLYQSYIAENRIEFVPGTHDIPNSITTHRYERILRKNHYKDVIVWGGGDYYKEMEHIFKGVNIRYHVDDGKKTGRDNIVSPDIILKVKEALPVFVCSNRKQEIKMKIINDFHDYTGRIIV